MKWKLWSYFILYCDVYQSEMTSRLKRKGKDFVGREQIQWLRLHDLVNQTQSTRSGS